MVTQKNQHDKISENKVLVECTNMVDLTIKNLKNQTFTISIELSSKVSALKEKVAEKEGCEVALVKLIHSGKILTDDSVLESYNIKEKDFIVLMITKPTKKKAPAPEAEPAAASSNTATTTPAAQASESTSTPTAGTGNSTLVTGESYDAAVKNLTEMGFPEDQVKAAMKAAFNHPDRAAEYLMNGIPESAQQPAPQQANAADTATPAPGATAAPNTAGQYVNLFDAANTANTPSDPADAFAFLRSSRQFQQLRQLVQTQPQLLQPVLQQLGQSNPQLLDMINQNQEAFLNVLMGDAASGGPNPSPLAGMPTEGAQAGGAAPPPADDGYVSVQVTPEENEAIGRLVSLGFGREAALEAYLACDKNEELAANFLMDGGGGWD